MESLTDLNHIAPHLNIASGYDIFIWIELGFDLSMPVQTGIGTKRSSRNRRGYRFHLVCACRRLRCSKGLGCPCSKGCSLVRRPWPRTLLQFRKWLGMRLYSWAPKILRGGRKRCYAWLRTGLKEISKCSAGAAGRFDWKHSATALLQLYEEAIASPKRTSFNR